METLTNFIAVIVGALVSVGLEVIPGVKEKWNDWKYKALVLFGLFEAVPLVLWALACFAGISFYPMDSCGAEGALRAAVAGFVGFMATQTTYAVGTRNTTNAKVRNQAACSCK
jgi:hypothetical protein